MARLTRDVMWPQILSQHCQEWRLRPFDWDGADCATFAGDGVLSFTGVDPIAEVRGRYSTKLGALRVIKSSGFESLGDMIADILPECRLDEVMRGDVVLFDGEDGDFIGLNMGHFSVAPHGKGLIQISNQFAKRGFMV